LHLLNHALRRIAQMIPVLLLITVVIFLIIKVIPGDPAQAILGERASQEAVQALRHQWGLDRPLWEQYFLYMQRLFHGDLGTSFRYKAEVMQLLPRRAGVTVFLVLYSTLLAVVLSIPLAIVSALNRDRWPDQMVRVVTTLPLASPVFWMGILFLLLFSLRLKWFPASGFGDGGFTDHLKHLFLPALTLSMHFMCLLTRNLRSGIIDVLQVTYVDFARAKGLPRMAILVRHILRSAMLSVVTLVGVHLAYSIGGAVITETIFALPGLGTFMVESIFSRDYQVVQSLTFIFALGTMVINLATDLVYSLLDPRVRMD
jgi:peptide/nickel transport system permease protein